MNCLFLATVHHDSFIRTYKTSHSANSEWYALIVTFVEPASQDKDDIALNLHDYIVGVYKTNT